MKSKFLLILTFSLVFSLTIFSQEPLDVEDTVSVNVANGYLIGPGDKLTGKVMGEPDFGFEVVISESGVFRLPYVDDNQIVAKCRTETEIKQEVEQKYAKYLKNPLISVQVTERRTPNPVTVFGEVRQPQRVELRREARLLQLLAFAGGINRDSAGGMVRVVRTQVPMCAEDEIKENWLEESNGGLEAPTRLYSISSIEEARNESNPIIYPGDLIIVEKAPPVYVIGEVNAIRELKITQNGLSLSEAIAQAGGFRERAKTKDITIRRIKENSRERDVISVNYKMIEDGKEKDIMLEPEDIVVVDKTKKSIGETILDIATGGVTSAVNTLPRTVLF